MSPTLRWYNQHQHTHLHEGAVWERFKGKHEPTITILKHVQGRAGERYLVQGVESGRQWLVGEVTLLGAYRPCLDEDT